MMRFARLNPRLALSTALLLATVGVAVHGRQQPAPGGAAAQPPQAAPPAAAAGDAAPDGEANRAIARQQLALIDRALDSLRQQVAVGKVNPSNPAFSVWGRRRLETLRRTGAGKAEIVAAIENYIKTLKYEEAVAEEMRRLARGGTPVDIFDVQYRRMEAEIWLNEEKAR